jgi:metallophosphoesterase superfamily enzyme
VSGNHDRKAGPPPAAFGIRQIVDRYARPPFFFRHQAQHLSGSYVLGGHLHPAVLLTGAGRQRERLPCFFFGCRYAVLPAFGGFTGHFAVRPKKGDRVFVIADNQVIEPPNGLMK